MAPRRARIFSPHPIGMRLVFGERLATMTAADTQLEDCNKRIFTYASRKQLFDFGTFTRTSILLRMQAVSRVTTS
jgi:hypothetical protein